ncbi:hypothetical protein [Companilactobacillus sp. HBUAS56275]
MIDIIEKLDKKVMLPIWQKRDVLDYIIVNGHNQELQDYLSKKCNGGQ